MNQPTWARPEFSEINLSAEIGMYVELEVQFDEPPGDPLDLDRSPSAPPSTVPRGA
ncbi:MAG: pyrroloquinoline quinone precursor peptide PqqA [Enhygromyxa sp.]